MIFIVSCACSLFDDCWYERGIVRSLKRKNNSDSQPDAFNKRADEALQEPALKKTL